MTGVSFDKRARKWVVRIRCNGSNAYLGKYDSREKASMISRILYDYAEGMKP